MTAGPAGSTSPHDCAKPVPRHRASARYTSPNCRERSTRTPFRRTGTATSGRPSSNSRACSGAPIRCPRQRPRRQPALLVKLAKLRHRLLNDPTADPYAAHQTPIAVNLPVLLSSRVAQVHVPSEPITTQKKSPRSALHAQITPQSPLNT